MAQREGNRRTATNIVTCALLLLLGVLSLASGCSSVDASALEGSAAEEWGVSQQPQLIGECDAKACAGLSNPCGTWACDGNACKPAKTFIKEGDTCVVEGQFKGLCHLGLCCPGCVIVSKASPPQCAPREGTADIQCGVSGVTCENCTNKPCAEGACSARKSCEFKELEDGAACRNTTGACLKGDCCKGCLDGNGVCQPGGALNACGVSDGKLAKCSDCTDSDPCTSETCSSGRCGADPAPANTSCSDGNKCNGDEFCSGTTCSAGKELDCDDGEECTVDACDAAGGCSHTPRTGQGCNDGNACTTDDKCGADGKCKPGAQINCNDGETCTQDSCANGKCVNTAITGTCNDNDMCTTADMCVGGKCKGTSQNGVDCDDKKACTIDKQVSCTGTACSNVPAPITTACPAPDKCHENGHCSGTDDTCVAGPEINCDDSNPCTKDSCVGATGCVHTNDPSADCSDGDPCTENDVCVAGQCGGKPKKCLALDSCHEGGTCDPESGTCDDPRSEDGKECPGGSCEAGKCVLDPNHGFGGEGAGGESAAGGETATGAGGEGNAATSGGDNGGGTAGSGGTSATGATNGNGEGGETVDPTRVFQREPGGCSCNVPASERSSSAWLVGLGFAALVAARRRSRARAESRIS